MVSTRLSCIHCSSEDIVKYGKKPNGAQRLKCNHCKKLFQEAYINNGAKPETKSFIIKMSVNGSGIRDISRVLGVSQNTVMSVLKKRNQFSQI